MKPQNPPKKSQKKKVKPILGGGLVSNILGIFTPKIGEDEPSLTSIFFSKGLKLNHQPVIIYHEIQPFL